MTRPELDVAVDPARRLVFAAGPTLYGASADFLAAPLGYGVYRWTETSVEVASDRSVWVTDADYDVPSPGHGHLTQFREDGTQLASFDLPAQPMAVRVHPRTGDVWVSLTGNILRFDGTTLHTVGFERSGFDLAPDYETDGVWVVSGENVVLVAPDGAVTRLHPLLSSRTDQRYLRVVPPT